MLTIIVLTFALEYAMRKVSPNTHINKRVWNGMNTSVPG
jgi:hypothetical protein